MYLFLLLSYNLILLHMYPYIHIISRIIKMEIIRCFIKRVKWTFKHNNGYHNKHTYIHIFACIHTYLHTCKSELYLQLLTLKSFCQSCVLYSDKQIITYIHSYIHIGIQVHTVCTYIYELGVCMYHTWKNRHTTYVCECLTYQSNCTNYIWNKITRFFSA